MQKLVEMREEIKETVMMISHQIEPENQGNEEDIPQGKSPRKSLFHDVRVTKNRA